MNQMKKIILPFLLMLMAMTMTAQTTTIYGKVIKGDGSRIKGTSVMKGYEDQLIIVNFSGGVDNTASLEIEVPTSACVTSFRNMIKTESQQPLITKPAGGATIKPSVAAVNIAPGKITTQSLQVFPISRMDISVTSRVGNNLPTLTRQIILENAIVERCTDDLASNTSKIKLKANRIGWITINFGPDGKIRSTDKSGWDLLTGAAWTSF
jgi:filamentous hemagglutinin family protein